MVKLGLKPLKRNKRKYSSYKGTVGKIADNLIERDFNADKPNKKWYTDVTEFNLRGEKCYLSPILDGFNGEVISYNTSKSPNLEQINDMLNKAFDKNNNLDGLIFHSDQGWQYQHQSYQQRLKNKGIDKELVGQTAAVIRTKRPPEVYRGKGIKYAEEVIRRKVGKTGK